jgi:hemophore-related protein
MIKMPWAQLAVAVAGSALLFTAQAVVASADPDLGPIVNTTCTYPQVMAALNAQNPAAAAEFNSSPIAQAYLHQFLASPPSQRLTMAQELADDPEAQEQLGLIQQVAAACNKY